MAFRSLAFMLAASMLFVTVGCSSGSTGANVSPQTHARPTEPTLAPPAPGSYAAMGASETYGVGVVPRTNSYPYLVKQTLGARSFVDVGIPGATLNAAYQGELSRALDIRPSFVSVLFGTNDILAGYPRAQFMRDLTDLVSTLRMAHVRVLIVGLPDLSYFPRVKKAGIGGVHEIVVSWNAGMRAVARATGSSFLDLAAYSQILARHPNYITADGLHPGYQAHVRLARLIVQEARAHHLWRPS